MRRLGFKRFSSISSVNLDAILKRDLYNLYMVLTNNAKYDYSNRDVPYKTLIDKTEIKYYPSPDDYSYEGFLEHLQSRTLPIQTFVGQDFQLLLAERMQIICGLTELPINITNYHRKSPSCSLISQVYTSDQLRDFGKQIYELQLRLMTTFHGNHLSLSKEDLENSLLYFSNPIETIIPFMKWNIIYDCIIPFSGTQIFTFKDKESINFKKEQIKNSTAIASFYTMLGMLCMKFGTATVADKVINEKILLGSNGIIKIVSENLSRNRK